MRMSDTVFLCYLLALVRRLAPVPRDEEPTDQQDDHDTADDAEDQAGVRPAVLGRRVLGVGAAGGAALVEHRDGTLTGRGGAVVAPETLLVHDHALGGLERE